MNDEAIYELISEEIESSSTKKGIWTKAFSESGGDEQKTKALYIKYRFNQIKDGQSHTDEEKSSNKNEELNTSENISICYLCGKSNANHKILFDGSLRKFCDDECYSLCLKNRSTLKKSSEEELEHWEKRNKKMKEESLGNNDLEQSPEKFGGFLLFLAYLLPISFILTPFAAVSNFAPLTQLMMSANPEIKDAASAYMDWGMVKLGCSILLLILLLFLFYKKKKNFPKIYIFYLIVSWGWEYFLTVSFFDVIAKYSPNLDSTDLLLNSLSEPKVWFPLIFNVFLLLYFANSNRVKKTFTQ